MTGSGERRHALELRGHPLRDWALVCLHEPGEFFTTTEDGEKESDDCWVMSWWEALSPEEMLAEDGWVAQALRIPVRAEGDGWSDGCLLVPLSDNGGPNAGATS